MKILALFLVPLLSFIAFADWVVPIDEVEDNVNIRLFPDASSEIVGRLDQGAATELVSSIEGWYEVQLEGGATGYISADWTRVVVDEVVVDEPVVEAVVASVEQVAAEVAEEVAEEVASAMISDRDDGKVSVATTQVEGMDDFLIVGNSHRYMIRSDVVIRNTQFFLRNGSFLAADKALMTK